MRPEEFKPGVAFIIPSTEFIGGRPYTDVIFKVLTIKNEQVFTSPIFPTKNDSFSTRSLIAGRAVQMKPLPPINQAKTEDLVEVTHKGVWDIL